VCVSSTLAKIFSVLIQCVAVRCSVCACVCARVRAYVCVDAYQYLTPLPYQPSSLSWLLLVCVRVCARVRACRCIPVFDIFAILTVITLRVACVCTCVCVRVCARVRAYVCVDAYQYLTPLPYQPSSLLGSALLSSSFHISSVD